MPYGWSLVVSFLMMSVAMGPVAGTAADSVPAKREQRQPKLTISTAALATEVWSGGEITYRVEVENIGETDVSVATVSHILPDRVAYRSSSPAAYSAERGETVWRVSVPAGETVALTIVGDVGWRQIVDSEEPLPEFAAIACVAQGDIDDAAASVACTSGGAVPVNRAWWSPLRSPAAAAVGLAALAVIIALVVILRSGRPRDRAATVTAASIAMEPAAADSPGDDSH